MSRTVEEIEQEQEALEEKIQQEIDERCLCYIRPDKNTITIMVRNKYAAVVQQLSDERFYANMEYWLNRWCDEISAQVMEATSSVAETDRSDSVQMTTNEIQYYIAEAWNRVNNVQSVDVSYRCRDPCLVL